MTARGGLYEGPGGQMLHGDGSVPYDPGTSMSRTMDAVNRASERVAAWPQWKRDAVNYLGGKDEQVDNVKASDYQARAIEAVRRNTRSGDGEDLRQKLNNHIYHPLEAFAVETYALLLKAQDEIQAFREALWLGHGHALVYGDDGEMQCSSCSPGQWDYKRGEPKEVVQTALKSAVATLIESRDRVRQETIEECAVLVETADPYDGRLSIAATLRSLQENKGPTP